MNYKFCTYIENTQRVDIYLSALFGDFSRSYIQKLIDKGSVKVNNQIINKNLKIKNKDLLEITIEQESIDIKPEEGNLDIIYEDENIIIVNKEAGVNVHPVPGENGKTGTLVNFLLNHCKNKLPSIGGVERPGIVHRLDKDTSGLIIIAKTDKMMKILSDTFKQRDIDKYYIAIVNGILKDNKIRIESYIGRDRNDRLKMTTIDPINPKIAITNGELIGTIDNKYSVLKLKIETGRTHQIRVHLASIGFPIIGDKVYGNKKVNDEVKVKYDLDRQALHAYEVGFNLYDKKVNFKALLKADMKNIIKENIL